MPDRAGLDVELRQDAPISLDVRFSCAPGEVLALVGPSGSGKSTVLKTIAGIYRPRSGHVRVGRVSWFDSTARLSVPARLRSVGFVFQSYALFPHLTAVENVIEAMGHVAAAERPVRAADLLRRTHLGGLEDRRPSELSGGQQQRVAIARALARDPAVLLLDEPFSAVDQVTREKLYEELVLLRGEFRIPTVLVTHALTEASMLADRMCVLHRGRSLQVAPPIEVMTRPASIDVARLVAMKNIFDGEIVARDGNRLRLRWGDLMLELNTAGDTAPGTRVTWVIPSSNVILHRRDKPSHGERENPVTGVAASVVQLGEATHVQMHVGGDRDRPLFLTIPTHVARRNDVRPGGTITVSLLAEGIHLIPA
jgi:molybdate transport system ATP-binding protein